MYTKITFEDHGQDFLEWMIDDKGKVVDCQPFQASIWTKCYVMNTHKLRVGGPVVIFAITGDLLTMNYPVEKLETLTTDQALPIIQGDEIYH